MAECEHSSALAAGGGPAGPRGSGRAVRQPRPGRHGLHLLPVSRQRRNPISVLPNLTPSAGAKPAPYRMLWIAYRAAMLRCLHALLAGDVPTAVTWATTTARNLAEGQSCPTPHRKPLSLLFTAPPSRPFCLHCCGCVAKTDGQDSPPLCRLRPSGLASRYRQRLEPFTFLAFFATNTCLTD